AFRIASTVLPLSTDRLRKPRGHNDIQSALQIMLTARDELARERTRAVNALTALLRTIDLGIDARRAVGMKVIRQIASWRSRKEPLGLATARAEAIRLAQRVRQTHAEIVRNDAQLASLVAQSPAAGLTNETGIGPVTAATVLVAWAHTLADSERGSLCRLSWCQPTARIVRQHRAIPAQPRRRSPTQPSSKRDRDGSDDP